MKSQTIAAKDAASPIDAGVLMPKDRDAAPAATYNHLQRRKTPATHDCLWPEFREQV
jgi:hypothetical protein